MKKSLMEIVQNEIENTRIDLLPVVEKYDFRFKMISFFEANKWFDLMPQLIYTDDECPIILFDETDVSLVSNEIFKWISIYNSDNDECFSKLRLFLQDKYPKTIKILLKYFDINRVDLSHKIAITEYMLFRLNTEIVLYEDVTLDNFVETLCIEQNLSIGMIICDFLSWVLDTYETSYTNRYKLSSRGLGDRNNSAYESETYLRLVYYLFNSDYLEETNVTEKIATSQKSANAFLYLSLHFICGLRDSDLVRLPKPILESEPNEILDAIKDDTFSDQEARAIVNSIEFQIYHLNYAPSKTSRHTNISDIKFFVPESCRVIVGKYFAALEAHRQANNIDSSKGLIKVVTDPYDLGDAMGEDFFELFLYENFSSRRANKAYLQSLEAFANSDLIDVSAPKGYILASLARSHKGGYYEFASTTEVYLKDSKFTALTPKFVARELFERGVCSFIPHMLLSMLEAKSYSGLPLSKQTQMIKKIGMTANEIESITNTIEMNYMSYAENVKRVLSSEEDIKESITIILHNIGSNAAASKQEESLCLLTAMSKMCEYPERQHCFGCDFEVKTKSLTYRLAGEYKRLKQVIADTNNQKLKEKSKSIINNILLPSMEEILQYTKINYGSEGIDDLNDIIRRYT